jgi:UDPglucose 6-dehydrogenase
MGAGYVGLVTSACLAELGNEVTCIDVNEEKIKNLQQNISPIYEPGLDEMIVSNQLAGRLHFTTALSKVLIMPQVIFIAVGTPSEPDGSANISYVLGAAKDIGDYLNSDCVIVDKSTVPVGMADQVYDVIQLELAKRGLSQLKITVVSNPEFLREGQAIDDFLHPDRVIVGLSSDEAKRMMEELYRPIVRDSKLIFMSVKAAEMTKYVANAMLAIRISAINEMALLCSKLGVDIENVRIGIGSDTRIGPAFLNAGCGYGGSCFPKDVKALIKMAEDHGVEPMILHAIEKRNYLQKYLLPEKIISLFGDNLKNIIVAVWGLAFKPGTDDMREASSIVLIEEVIKRGATVQVFDPVAMEVAREIFPKEWVNANKLIFVEHHYDALQSADVLALVTEWKLFCYPDIKTMKDKMRKQIILDGRNQYDPQQMREAGFEYYGVGR